MPTSQPAAVPAMNANRLSDELAVLVPEVAKVLPPHIAAERFVRTVRTAITTEPRLAQADRRSLLIAAIRCAQDGLMPDGKEAAFVAYKTKDRDSNRYIDRVQYMPMVAGIVKKLHNTGQILNLSAIPVYEADQFRFWLDDGGEHVSYEMNVDAPDRGRLRLVCAMAWTKGGGTFVEVMTTADIEAVRATSRARDDGPWVQWYSEMARKSVIRRLSKRLPMHPELERVIRRDDELYEVEARQQHHATGAAATRSALGLSDSTQPAASVPAGSPWTDENAIFALTEAASTEAVYSVWADIASHYIQIDKQIPVAVEATFNDRLKALAQEAGQHV